jgi:hypothetical protein
LIFNNLQVVVLAGFPDASEHGSLLPGHSNERVGTESLLGGESLLPLGFTPFIWQPMSMVFVLYFCI